MSISGALVADPGRPNLLVARRADLARLQAEVGASRLVSVVGLGGVGKTALARAFAQSRRGAFDDGTWWVELGASRGREAVIDAIAEAVRAGSSSVDAIVERLSDRRALILLDNCEQVLEPVAELCEILLGATTGISIIATSRQPLRMPGEVVFAIYPLNTAVEPAASAELAELSEAGQLFAARAQQLGVAIASSEIPAVNSICLQLDGLPLAIELAVRRLSALTVEQLDSRIAGSMQLLTLGSRSAPTRQQTLEASIRWSYELCTEPEQALWRALAMFAGGADFEAVEFLGAGLQFDPDQTLDALTGLVEKSVVERWTLTGRYTMPATLREFGQRLLVERGELEVARKHHRDWCIALIEGSVADWISPRQSRWVRRIAHDFPNIRLAIDEALAMHDDPEDVLRLIVPAWRWAWLVKGRLGDLRDLLEETLARVEQETDLAITAVALLLYIRGRVNGYVSVEADYAVLRERSQSRGEYTQVALLDAALAFMSPDAPETRARLESALARAQHDPRILTLTGVDTGVTLIEDRIGDRAVAERMHAAMVQRSAQTGEKFELAYLEYGLGANALMRGEAALAVVRARESMMLRAELPVSVMDAQCVEVIAAAAVLRGDYRDAGVLYGIADALLAQFASSRAFFVPPRIDRDEYWAALSSALSESALRTAVADGASLAPDAAVAFALGTELPESAYASHHELSAERQALTAREREVADLIARGLTNREIAAQLVISTRTAEGHVQRILEKLGLSNRSQIGAVMSGRL